MTLAQLRETIFDLFMDNPDDRMSVKVMSFGFKYGNCREADLVFDVRCLPNPFYIPELKKHTGLESCVRDYVMSFDSSKELDKKLIILMTRALNQECATGISRSESCNLEAMKEG